MLVTRLALNAFFAWAQDLNRRRMYPVLLGGEIRSNRMVAGCSTHYVRVVDPERSTLQRLHTTDVPRRELWFKDHRSRAIYYAVDLFEVEEEEKSEPSDQRTTT